MTKANEDSGFVRNDRILVPRLPIGYVWESVLAAGAMGVVHRVLHVALNRSVAFKIITAAPRNISEYRERFHSEARALGKIDHPGIVQVFDYGDLDEIPFLVMEFCQGGNLGDLMVRRQVAPMHAAALVARLAEAIHHAHNAGIVHRDLKPANILIKHPVQCIDDLRPEDLRIADFGLAKHIWDSEWGITRSGQVVGTALYMAPEQIRSADKAGPGADIYALGTILYEIIAGRVPFQAPTFLAVIRLLEFNDAPPLRSMAPSCPTDLETICHKCLAKKTADRYSSAMELEQDLRRFIAGEPIKARRPNWTELFMRWVVRHPLLTGLLLMAVFSPVASVLYIQWLASQLVRHTAVEAVMQQADLLLQANDEYSDIVKKVRDSGYGVTHDPFPERGMVPLSIPATFVHDIGARLEKSLISGIRVRLYSNYPFPWRVAEGGPRDEYEREALSFLEQNPDHKYIRFDEKDGKRILRYSIARVLKNSCVDCHNSRADSPKKDWKEGDVRGVLELTRPLHHDEEAVRGTIRGPMIGVTVISGFLIVGALSALALQLSGRQPISSNPRNNPIH